MMKVTESREKYKLTQRTASNLVPLKHRSSVTETETACDTLNELWGKASAGNFDLISEQPIFHSSAHLELLLRQTSRTVLYLDKSLHVRLCYRPEKRNAMHRSTLSLKLGKLHVSSSRNRQNPTSLPFQNHRQHIADCTAKVTPNKDNYFRTGSFVFSEGDTKADSGLWQANFRPQPSRTGCHSSLGAFRLNEKANDVSRPLQSNQRRGTDGQGKNPSCFSGKCKWGQSHLLSLPFSSSLFWNVPPFPYHSWW